MSKRKWLNRLAIMGMGGGGMLYVYLSGMPQLPVSMADGIYANDCCGTIELSHGLMTINSRERLSYVIERSKVGPYVLPMRRVSLVGGELKVSPSKHLLMLPLDSATPPATLSVVDYETGRTFLFKRQAG